MPRQRNCHSQQPAARNGLPLSLFYLIDRHVRTVESDRLVLSQILSHVRRSARIWLRLRTRHFRFGWRFLRQPPMISQQVHPLELSPLYHRRVPTHRQGNPSCRRFSWQVLQLPQLLQIPQQVALVFRRVFLAVSQMLSKHQSRSKYARLVPVFSRRSARF